MKLSRIFIALFTFFPWFTYAQSLFGVVKDAKTNEPLPSANVFINNTTIGAVTGLDGKFRFSFDGQGGSYEIIISFVGYSGQSIKVTPNEKEFNLGTVLLQPLDIQLVNVEVKSKRDKDWERKLKRFKKVFLGEDKLAAACTIKNPWVLEFDDSNSVLGLRAKAEVPLEIENNALGYRILFHLKDFWANKKAYSILGNAFFTELSTHDIKFHQRWESNRLKAYSHSTHHLFKSIINQKLNGEGFSLYQELKGFENATSRSSDFYNELGKTITNYDTGQIVSRDLREGHFRIHLKGRIEVHYNNERAVTPFYNDFTGPVSWLQLKNGYVIVDEEGFPKNPSDLVVSGAMSLSRVSRMLPLDYQPANSTLNQIDLSFFKEQIYVHTDRPYYYPSETIWFKGYMNYHWPAWRDSLSHTVYVELIDREKSEVVVKKTIRIDSGFFQNNFELPTFLESKDYYLRAYTSLNRNFGDGNLYLKQIPILNIYEKPEAVDGISGQPLLDPSEKGMVEILTDKKEYLPQDMIAMTFIIKDDNGDLVESNFSVSITDTSKVVPIEFSTIVKSYPMHELAEEKTFQRLKFPVEYGINFSGRFVIPSKGNLRGMLNVIQLDRPNMTLAERDKDGLFSVNGLVFYDTGKFYISSVERNIEEAKVEIFDRKPADIVFSELSSSTVKRIRVDSPQRYLLEEDLLKDSKMLNEVEVKAKRVFEEKPIDRTKRSYGRSDYVLTRKDINSSYSSLLQILPGKFPGLIVRQAANDGEGLRWVVYLSKGGTSSSILNPREVLITINDVMVSGNPEQILSAIDPNSVESIELTTRINVLYGSLGGDGVLAIYTKKEEFDDVKSKLKKFPMSKIVGYSRPAKFDPTTTVNNHSIIYWNPEIKTSETGLANIIFSAPSLPGQYRVVVEGVNKKGEPFRGTAYVTVSAKEE